MPFTNLETTKPTVALAVLIAAIVFFLLMAAWEGKRGERAIMYSFVTLSAACIMLVLVDAVHVKYVPVHSGRLFYAQWQWPHTASAEDNVHAFRPSRSLRHP